MDCDAISEAFLSLHAQDGFSRLPPSSLLHDSVPMSFVMSAGLIQVENDLEKIVEQTGGKFAFTQPCFRHFDMKQVGTDPTRLSLFHMSAAFHIGCSERETVLPRLWHFLTDVLGLEKERLWVTYLDDGEFGRDEASYRCWRELGVDTSRLVGLDQEHCFWRQRSTGQIASDGKKCGPHTEVFYERPEVVCAACENREKAPGTCRCGRFVEISNSLFIENYIGDDGKLIPAETVFAECVLGLERVEMVLRELPSVYHAHRFSTWQEQLSDIGVTSAGYTTQKDIHTIFDHLYAFLKLTADGAPAPGKGGRKYIMRKLAREAMERTEDNHWDTLKFLALVASDQPTALEHLLEEYQRFIKNRRTQTQQKSNKQHRMVKTI
ncbi:alanine--tRNA ligase-related protein [Thiothrix nivea]|nr:alanine--tRNA ligase-related protein [Thiothrix nivea]